MKRKCVFAISGRYLLTLLLLTMSSLSAQTSVDLDRHGRRIQLDGFLLEWSPRTAIQWQGNQVWHWDAINTPEGLAGYFRTEGAPSCSTWTFRIQPEKQNRPLLIKISTIESSTFTTYEWQRDSAGAITIEWVVSWDSIHPGPDGTYGLELNGLSGCADSLEPLLLTGQKEQKPGFLSRGLSVRFLVVLVLLVAFIVLRIRIRNQNRRRQSLHQ